MMPPAITSARSPAVFTPMTYDLKTWCDQGLYELVEIFRELQNEAAENFCCLLPLADSSLGIQTDKSIP